MDKVWIIICDEVWTDGYTNHPSTHIMAVYKKQDAAARDLVTLQTKADEDAKKNHYKSDSYQLLEVDVFE